MGITDKSQRRGRGAAVQAAAGAVAAAALALAHAPTAHAAWATAGSAPGIGAAPSVLTGGPGEATIVGIDALESLNGAHHVPGATAFGAPFGVVGAADQPQSLPVGAGGALAAAPGSGPVVRRIHADGSVSAPVAVGDDESTIVGRPAAAPGGAAVVLVADADQDVQVWREAGDGAPFTRIGPVIASQASTADVVPSGPDSFVVAFAEPRDPAGTHVRTLRITGAAVGAPRTVDAITTPSTDTEDYGFDQIRLVGGVATFVATTPDGATLRSANVDVTGSATTVAGPLGADDGFFDTSVLPVGGGGSAIAWSQSAGEAIVTGYALLGAGGNRVCSTPEPFTAVALVDRGGPTLVGLLGDGTVATVPVSGACGPGAPALGPNLGAGDALAAGVDGDGALVVGVSSSTDEDPPSSSTALAVDDATAPSLTDVQIPATVQAGTAFGVSAAAADAWGVGDVVWSVDGAEVARGSTATLPGLAAGRHQVRAAVRNTAGLETASAATVTAAADAPPPPPPTPPAPTQPAPPVPVAAAAAPVDATAPQISRLRVVASLIRPKGAGGGGTDLRFLISEDASVRVTLLRAKPKPGGRSRCTAT